MIYKNLSNNTHGGCPSLRMTPALPAQLEKIHLIPERSSTIMLEKPENWKEMAPEQKRTFRLNNFQKSGEKIEFINQDAENAYNIRVKRLIHVYNVEEPDRVPLNLPMGNLPLTMGGINRHTAMYEPEKAIKAYNEFNKKYSEELEHYSAPFLFPGEALEILDYRLYAWPGHGISTDAPDLQFIEGEYMTEDEYDDLIRDPTDFWLRRYLPRCLGAFKGFSMFQPFTNITESVHMGQLMPLAMPEVRGMLQKMLDAGKAFEKFNSVMAGAMGQGPSYGYPFAMGNFCKAPFDILGDTLRGTTNIMMDMFRRPEKLLRALDVIADITINTILNTPNIDDTIMVSYPLHKGADGWMSQEQFDTFYWPSLKKVMSAFIEQGLIQRLFAEGGYNSRLHRIDEFPKGSVIWYFDRTDMAKAKEMLGSNCCIQGNVPASLIVTGTPEDVTKYCQKLIEDCAPRGGYIMSAGCMPENPKLENLKAMVDTVNRYGYYD